MEMEEILERLRDQGLRLTPQRIALIQSLAGQHKTAGNYQVRIGNRPWYCLPQLLMVRPGEPVGLKLQSF